ncbi:MAG: PQQ-dependent sugar dehydrogenase [Planctomycetaceae bacterium]|nr:PQQ-dependent sugar dehydrogenase [Planctomycetaceae bacterium]
MTALRFCSALLAVLSLAGLVAADEPAVTPLASGLVNPESAAVGVSYASQFPKFTVVVSEIGERDKDGDGKITIIAGAEKKTLADGLDDPKGLVFVGEQLFVTDKTRVWRVGPKGGKEVFAAAEAFPKPPIFLNDIEADADGNIYVSDSGDREKGGGGVYKIASDGKVTTILDSANPVVKRPNGLLLIEPGKLLVVDAISGELNQVNLADNSVTKIADGFEGGDGLTRDFDGNVYVTQISKGILSLLRGGKSPAVKYGPQFTASADLTLNPKTGQLLVPDMKAGTLSGVSIVSARPTDIDASVLESVKIEPAFPLLEEEVQRPIVITHAGDGSGRVFVASQLGNVYVLDKADDKAEPKLFFEFQSHVTYNDKENEEGFLGLAFHPKFKENGQFFVFYTKKDAPPHTSVISRFRVSSDDRNKADPATEEELLRVPQPFWNHNGGTLSFGPDGKLYIGLGDGGAFNDPHGNGQNLATLNGSILRIDVDAKDEGKNYAVPSDNPFVGRKDAAGEIWAYGIRNIWRLAFDRKTGVLWAADVGQDIWEEIDIIVRGGNYGWNKREGMHKFRAEGSLPDPSYIEPIWEYHHDDGRSITGGVVYRGKKLPELDGKYLYADYIRGTVWALGYDFDANKVVSNREIKGNVAPVVSFGEDEDGEVYFTTTGPRFFRFAPAK